MLPTIGFSHRAPNPNSGVLVLPTMIAPARRNRSTTSSSLSGTCCAHRGEPLVVRMPRVSTRSLMATGTPCSNYPAETSGGMPSSSAARARASSEATVMNAHKSGSICSMRARQASRTSVARRSPRCVACAISLAVRRQKVSWLSVMVLPAVGGNEEMSKAIRRMRADRVGHEGTSHSHLGLICEGDTAPVRGLSGHESASQADRVR